MNTEMWMYWIKSTKPATNTYVWEALLNRLVPIQRLEPGYWPLGGPVPRGRFHGCDLVVLVLGHLVLEELFLDQLCHLWKQKKQNSDLSINLSFSTLIQFSHDKLFNWIFDFEKKSAKLNFSAGVISGGLQNYSTKQFLKNCWIVQNYHNVFRSAVLY